MSQYHDTLFYLLAYHARIAREQQERDTQARRAKRKRKGRASSSKAGQ